MLPEPGSVPVSGAVPAFAPWPAAVPAFTPGSEAARAFTPGAAVPEGVADVVSPLSVVADPMPVVCVDPGPGTSAGSAAEPAVPTLRDLRLGPGRDRTRSTAARHSGRSESAPNSPSISISVDSLARVGTCCPENHPEAVPRESDGTDRTTSLTDSPALIRRRVNAAPSSSRV
ncbi:hypothetical protein NCCP2495_11600 [Dietzia sp. NCCP-2495]|nr:hypothetical protein NCCP2495_11600 [Dietzia sp. NCCP-2495]